MNFILDQIIDIIYARFFHNHEEMGIKPINMDLERKVENIFLDHSDLTNLVEDKILDILDETNQL